MSTKLSLLEEQASYNKITLSYTILSHSILLHILSIYAPKIHLSVCSSTQYD